MLIVAAVYDLQVYNDFLVVASQEGVLEIYENYTLVDRVDKLRLVTFYNQAPGKQSHQLGRMLYKVESGIVFFLMVKELNEIAYIDLNADRLKLRRVPNFNSDTITSFFVHEYGHGYVEMISPKTMEHQL